MEQLNGGVTSLNLTSLSHHFTFPHSGSLHGCLHVSPKSYFSHRDNV